MLGVLLGVAVVLLALELVLRFFPVVDGPWAVAVNAGQPVFRYEPNQRFVYSKGWNFQIANRGTVNNAGFVNGENYAQRDHRPLLAVIGDSQVEALMVPNAQTFHRRLAATLGPRGRVYSFGTSGAPLSQYLAWARYATEAYGAAAIAFAVIGNDFDESLAAYNTKAGYHLYHKTGGNELRLELADYRPSWGRALVRRSALGRYLVFNLHALESLQQLPPLLTPSPARASPPPYAGYTSTSLDSARVADSYHAIEAFLRDLPRMTGLAPDRVLFLLDGARHQDEIAGIEESYFGLMRRRFMERATGLGYEVVDLQPLLVAHSKTSGHRMDFPTDGHWNGRAHAVVADAVDTSGVFRTLFARDAATGSDSQLTKR